MSLYVFRRVGATLPTLCWVLVLVFFGMRILPGDPAIAMLGSQAGEEALHRFREAHGLNQPLWVQFWLYFRGALNLDLGVSYETQRPVGALIFEFLPYTLDLAIFSVFLALVIGIPLGVMMAAKRDSVWDLLGGITALGGISIPSFCLSVILILVFSTWLGLFPTMGEIDMGSPLSRLYHAVLPSCAVGFVQAAPIMRVTRAAMLDVMNEPYVQAARAKGLPDWRVTFHHALRNALIPAVTVAITGMTVALGGIVVVEIIFNRPGLGKLLLGGVENRDFQMIQGTILVYSVMVVLINLALDLLYVFIDPRVTYGREDA